MKNFIDFVVDSAKESKLSEEFHQQLNKADHSGMANWLKDKGYDVQADECKKIIDNKDDMKASKVGLMY